MNNYGYLVTYLYSRFNGLGVRRYHFCYTLSELISFLIEIDRDFCLNLISVEFTENCTK